MKKSAQRHDRHDGNGLQEPPDQECNHRSLPLCGKKHRR